MLKSKTTRKRKIEDTDFEVDVPSKRIRLDSSYMNDKGKLPCVEAPRQQTIKYELLSDEELDEALNDIFEDDNEDDYGEMSDEELLKELDELIDC